MAAIASAAAAHVVVRGPEGEVHAFGEEVGGTYRISFPGLARFVFRPPSTKIRATFGPLAAEDLVIDLFRTTVRPVALQILGFEALHASSVRAGEDVLAFCGTSGTGKSTVAYGLSRRGWPLWSDDAVIFDTEASTGVRCFQLPYTVQLRDATRDFFAVGQNQPPGVEDGNEDTPRALAAITVLERHTGNGHEIRRLDSGEALRAILPHAYRFTLTDRQRTRRTVESYLDLVTRVPVLRARFSPSFAQLPAFLDELEETLRELPG